MRYQETLRFALQIYPRLFIDEHDVMHHMFFVIGNGFEWVGGELVYWSSVSEAETELARKSARKPADAGGYVYETGDVERDREVEIQFRREVIADEMPGNPWFLSADDRIGRSIYPVSQYSRIMTVPEDVRTDWLDAAERALQWATSDLVRRTRRDSEMLNQARFRLEALRAARS